MQAAEYEARRQAEAFIKGDAVKRETRTFDVKSAKTVAIRTKEGAVDYRFLPEPDLPPLILDEHVSGIVYCFPGIYRFFQQENSNFILADAWNATR